jgi:hypothetical protein
MKLRNVIAALKKLLREVEKGSTPSVKREQELYSALLGLVRFVQDLDTGLALAGAGSIGSRLTRLEEQVAQLQERGE